MKTAQGAAMPRKRCSPRGTNAVVVSAATVRHQDQAKPGAQKPGNGTGHRPRNRNGKQPTS